MTDTMQPVTDTQGHAGALSSLLERQREMEEECVGIGVHRFMQRIQAERQAGRGSQVGAARFLLASCTERTAMVLRAAVEGSKGKRGPKPLLHGWAVKVGFDEFAYLTSRAILSSLWLPTAEVRVVALHIAEFVVDELRYRRFRETDPDGFEQSLRRLNTSSYVHASRSLRAIVGKNDKMQEIDLSDLELPPEQRLRLGIQAIEAFITANPTVVTRENIVESNARNHRLKPKNHTFLVATEETAKWLDARNERLAELHPATMPMLVPPAPWAPGAFGGYRFALKGKYTLVRSTSKALRDDIAKREMPVFYDALNRIQGTPWRINVAVLDVVRRLIERGGGVAGLPDFVDAPLPPKPADIAENEEARKAWRRAAAKVRNENRDRRMERIRPDRTVRVAARFEAEAEFYFPHNADFRGRIYPIADYLSPQGDDLSRGLLKFAVGRPMGEHGGRWLAIHLANSIDNLDGVKANKMTLDERVAWVEENADRIYDAGVDPLVNDWWMDSDAPFQTLAACVEWACWMDSGRSPSFVSSLPVAMDGSCNGLQHFAAMFRDEIGGAAVNVTANARPHDIYARVAEIVKDKLDAMAVDEPLALLWLRTGLVDRKLAKRPTMTFGYGSKKFGFKSQLIEYVRLHDRWKSGELRALFKRGEGEKSLLGPACGLMAGLIWEALGEVVVKAFAGMAWMQSAAGGVVRNGKVVEWEVPTGWFVRQEYYETEIKQVVTVLAGSTFAPKAYVQTSTPLAHRQRNAVAPNIIHSLDAAALVLTVDAAARSGVDSFGMIHDSYATVPGDAATLAHATRQSFFRLYSQDVAGSIAEQLKAHWKPEEMKDFPAPPEPGSLDLSEVLASDYFFA